MTPDQALELIQIGHKIATALGSIAVILGFLAVIAAFRG